MPRTDAVLADPRLVDAAGRLGPDTVKAAVVRAQAAARSGDLAPERVADAAVAGLPGRATTLRPVLNATGVVLHTNLGRAPLSAAAVEALVAAAGYADVEFDLGSGARARRGRGTLEALATGRAGDDGRFAFSRRFLVPGTYDVVVVTRPGRLDAGGTSAVIRTTVA